MKFKIIILVLTTVLVASGAAFADGQKDDGMGTLSGAMFFNYNVDIQNDDGSDKVHGLELERVYFTYKKSIGEKSSVRLTMDVYDATYVEADTDDDGSETTDVSSPKSRGLFFVKYAYYQYKDTLAGVKTTFQLGQIGNPILGLTDKMGGMRWITKNQMDIEGLNNSADLGAKITLDFFGFATLSTAYLNGESYKHIGGDENKGKSSDTALSIAPLGKKFLINGYFKYAKDVDPEKELQAGGGIGLKDKLYKVGLNYMYDSENKDSLLDSWANINFKELIGINLFLIGRFQLVVPDSGDNKISFLAGPGYKFNKNAQCALIFDYTDDPTETDVEMNVSLQLEFKF